MSSQQSSFTSHLHSRKGCKYAKIPLISKIRLFKSVVQDGMPIKRISEKLQIKYSTAKTLVRQYKDQEIQIDLKVLQNETNIPHGKRAYKDVLGRSCESEGKEDQASEMNLTTIVFQHDPAYNCITPFRSLQRVELVSTTISKH